MKQSKRKTGSPPDAFHTADRLHSVAIHLLRRVRKQDTASGEGPARLSALSVLVFGGPMTLGELAAAEQVKPPTMTRIVTGLEAGGLTQRIADSKDGRRVSVSATAKGVRLLQAARQRRIEALAGQLKLLSDKELRLLQDAADLLDQVLSQRP
jgi:DNA-binding MarR family transcriptional regulator